LDQLISLIIKDQLLSIRFPHYAKNLLAKAVIFMFHLQFINFVDCSQSLFHQFLLFFIKLQLLLPPLVVPSKARFL
jgi:hypothetical protein